MSTIYINTDGGARGNPGPAGIGIVFYDEDNNEVYKCKDYIGRATNNQAEYKAIIKAIDVLKQSKWFKNNNDNDSRIICRLDSQLVVEQLNGNYKVKNEEIKKFIDQIRSQLSEFEAEVSFEHIPRGENKLADKLVNNAIDKFFKSK